MRIDSHVHFWDPARGDYGWLDTAPHALQRPFQPGDLAPHLAEAGMDGVVLVQAAPTVAETDYLLDMAGKSPLVRGVVGWIDFEDPLNVSAVLDRLSANALFKGVRPMVQDMADDDWVLNEDFVPVFEALASRCLTFDALGFPRHMPRFQKVIDRHPSLTVVIDHAMKPQITEDEFWSWARQMRELAAPETTVCKLSGLLTEAGPGALANDIAPYVDHLLEVFGPSRIMFGSDWPVLTLAAPYTTWLGYAQELTHGLSLDERAAVFGGTAARVYRIA